MKIVIIDNYDSFTYNLVQGLGALGADVKVVRNDEIDVAGIEALAPEAILFSPGPGNPDSAGVTLEAIRAFAGKVPLFGVCLGHQSIAQAFGGKIIRAKRLMHGKTSRIRHDGRGLFALVSDGLKHAFIGRGLFVLGKGEGRKGEHHRQHQKEREKLFYRSSLHLSSS
jgi:anthranilate synthase/aminodeoxychorismate synthase-like glutamine amidotransferase